MNIIIIEDMPLLYSYKFFPSSSVCQFNSTAMVNVDIVDIVEGNKRLIQFYVNIHSYLISLTECCVVVHVQ